MNSGSHAETLPRLLYLSDVPVECSYHGSALLYRLLQDYPPDKLLVIEATPLRSLPERRLPDVAYRTFSVGCERWRNTRFSSCAGTWLLASCAARAKYLRRSLDEFSPDAILTVAHGYSWLVASKLAEDAKLPLHLIVHDDWAATTSVVSWARVHQDQQFAKAYGRATTRLCVSPYMEDEYRRIYGVEGQVVYPSRAKECPAFSEPPNTYRKHTGSLVGAYAGNIFSPGYAQLLAQLAQCLAARQGRLLLFGPYSSRELHSLGLEHTNIVPRGMFSSHELIARLREEADFVFVPMNFGGTEYQTRNMRVSFPSKLTDYTATGLPSLIWGPDYCSAVRWAKGHGPLAELVTSQDMCELSSAVYRLESVEHRSTLGRAAKRIGDQLFSHHACLERFHAALRLGLPDVMTPTRPTVK